MSRAIHGDDQIIAVRVEENPKRVGSMARKRFALYETGMTVRQALDAGIRRDDLIWDSKRQFITITNENNRFSDWVFDGPDKNVITKGEADGPKSAS